MNFGHVEVNIIVIMSTSGDHMQIEVDCILCQSLFNQSEAGILVGGMIIRKCSPKDIFV